MGVDLLEREAAVGAIRDVLAAARDGAGGGILVRAPAGLGKTSLLRAAVGDAAGARVLRARGAELERGFAFGLVRQLLGRAVVEDGRPVEGFAAAAAPLLLGSGPAAGDEWALLDALYWLVADMAADHPLALACDDLHWADDESVRFLAYLAHRIEDLPVAVVGATRPAEPGAPEGLLEAFAAEPAIRELKLEPLSADATAAIVRRRVAADDAACEAARAWTSGNPFLLGELLAALGEAGAPATADAVDAVCREVPEGLQALVVGRLRRLGDDAGALARAVAVLGDGAPAAVAAGLAGLDAAATAAAERRLVTADVLTRDVPLAFVHPLLRGAVLADLGPVAVATWRRRAAEALAAAGAPDETVAAQLLEIEPVGEPWAARALEAAGHEALARGAPGAAGRLFERALAETRDGPPRVDLLVAAGGALATVGDPRGIEHLLAAHAALEPGRARTELVQRIAIPLWFAGRSADYPALCRAELDALPAEETSLALRLRVNHAWSVCVGSADHQGELVAAALQLAPAADLEAPEDRSALALLSVLVLTAGHEAALARDLAARALGDAAAHEAAIDQGYPMPPALVALFLAEAACDDAEFDRIERGLRRRGAIALGVASTLGQRALTRAFAGDLAAAELYARTSLRLSPAGYGSARDAGLAALTMALAGSGRAQEALDEADPRAARPVVALVVDVAHAHALLACGRAAEAAAAAEAIGAALAAVGAGGGVLLPWRHTAAEARLALGDTAAALELAAADLSRAEAFGADGPVGMALRLLGLATGDIALLEDAERRLAGSPRRLEHAKALVDLGAALRRGRERAAAREPLAAGADLAARCGATPLVERARVELAAAGARPRSVVRTGVEALTPSERRVADLARDGLTNREIAQRLFVTPKTVEAQLRAAYRKLDIGGRTELQGALP